MDGGGTGAPLETSLEISSKTSAGGRNFLANLFTAHACQQMKLNETTRTISMSPEFSCPPLPPPPVLPFYCCRMELSVAANDTYHERHERGKLCQSFHEENSWMIGKQLVCL